MKSNQGNCFTPLFTLTYTFEHLHFSFQAGIYRNDTELYVFFSILKFVLFSGLYMLK